MFNDTEQQTVYQVMAYHFTWHFPTFAEMTFCLLLSCWRLAYYQHAEIFTNFDKLANFTILDSLP